MMPILARINRKITTFVKIFLNFSSNIVSAELTTLFELFLVDNQVPLNSNLLVQKRNIVFRDAEIKNANANPTKP